MPNLDSEEMPPSDAQGQALYLGRYTVPVLTIAAVGALLGAGMAWGRVTTSLEQVQRSVTEMRTEMVTQAQFTTVKEQLGELRSEVKQISNRR